MCGMLEGHFLIVRQARKPLSDLSLPVVPLRHATSLPGFRLSVLALVLLVL